MKTPQGPSHPQSTKEIAEQYKVSRQTIYRLIERGVLHPWRLGPRTLRFDAEEVAAAFRD